jgi:hypothetical protein
MTVRRVAFPILFGNITEEAVLIFYRQVQGHQQSLAGYGHGPLPMAAFCSLRWRLDGRQLVAAGAHFESLINQRDLPRYRVSLLHYHNSALSSVSARQKSDTPHCHFSSVSASAPPSGVPHPTLSVAVLHSTSLFSSLVYLVSHQAAVPTGLAHAHSTLALVLVSVVTFQLTALCSSSSCLKHREIS